MTGRAFYLAALAGCVAGVAAWAVWYACWGVSAVTDPARFVAMLIEQMLDESDEIVTADMRGMMSAVEVTLLDGSVVLAEVELISRGVS